MDRANCELLRKRLRMKFMVCFRYGLYIIVGFADVKNLHAVPTNDWLSIFKQRIIYNLKIQQL